MAHNLNEENGKVAFFGTKPAWHGLGQVVDTAQNSEEAIKLAGLDYEVIKRKVYACDDDCQDLNPYQEVPGYFVTVRQDTNVPLGIVGSRYAVLQNKDAFKFIDDLVASKEALFESAGALGRGERIWVSCKLPQKLVVGMDDVAENYFFITNSHDGTRSIEIAFTNTFICCNNTLREALRSAKRKKRVKHTINLQEVLMDTAELMGITTSKILEQKEMFEAMQKVKITDNQLKAFIEQVLKPEREQISEEEYSTRFKNSTEKILNYGLSDPAQMIIDRKGNLWGAYNAITGYYNNVEPGENKIKTIMYGNGFRKSQMALDVALDVMNNKLVLA